MIFLFLFQRYFKPIILRGKYERKDQQLDVLDNVASNRKSDTQMVRLYNINEGTISRIVAQLR